ncbi:tetraacyldisaccharide 4'-kinase [Polynucleobacter sp. AP-Nino-20-G2]|uniref:tetraacyldisaccharide 4'-kinase n=1 Tax=Polynucleobacter sp. AP-Nino-20-G2 TaxID=2576917 RepID=UPI001BFD300F|nr:tetraacyldisaccharide 4'-kinase [Polynucleobacter sp. AP-Nino-20-G2]QWE16923.1 tetraacyldisaccharide 4'-kinase [Polynucleobacter sp. AP-Nino-20-G2]
MPATKSTTRFKKAPKFWERRGPTSLLLWPLSWAYGLVNRILDLMNDLGISGRKPQSVPVIIVGNIRVGGTGKTPIVIALAERLSRMGWKPAIISRGYGAGTLSAPTPVQSDSDPTVVGDEPVLIAKRTKNQFPIWVYPKRVESIRALLKQDPSINVIISDDGLQHRSLARWPAREGGRDIEFVVRDARGEGNGFLLPAGPLREPATRERDATLMTGVGSSAKAVDEYFLGRRAFTLGAQLGIPYQLVNPSNTQSLAAIADTYLPNKITAIAAIGNPQRFFDDLLKQGIAAKSIGLPDHSTFTPEFFNAINSECILITEKDAVKCSSTQDERIWVVPMTLDLPNALADWLQSILQRPDPNQYTL